MLVKLNERVEDQEVAELLSYSVFPTAEALGRATGRYRGETDSELLGLEEEGRLVGIAGVRAEEDGVMTILHLAVHPELRGNGYGRGLLLELIAERRPSALIAETDAEAVDFYRSVGFVITSLGDERYGVERFLCRYDVEEDEQDEQPDE
ncbi:hypothetical protein J31TS4_02890 [Paenibacillus sp. J31TS4]|uniref:GNAT family N-acetyltransferase n=1 Tax=Paenibacillus sp. J31TS4 TaxID=2807195 RepID=UPI001B2AD2AC|nr:GNAT family N-acetyltransferase [Paenibacillus sp. J31TS4]GIP37009.1 hypothetical protein J31TS4_02890 [Paenibacillus sp. J31TS4]